MKPVSEVLGPIAYKIFRPLKSLPFLHKALRFGYYESMALLRFLEHRLRSLKNRESLGLEHFVQTVSRFEIPENDYADAPSLIAFLQKSGITFVESSHTIYLPPQDGLAKVFGGTSSNYPPDAGFKILKNFEPPETANYLNQNFIHAKRELEITGALSNQVEAANTLFALGLGPELYDLIELKNGSVSMSCFVCRHVAGEAPDEKEHAGFIEQINSHVEAGRFSLASIAGVRDDDFLDAPGCNGNLLKEEKSGQLHYVDFQQFLPTIPKVLDHILDGARTDLHFGDTRLVTGNKKFLYQAIPSTNHVAKRDTNARWPKILSLLASQKISLENRVVLDVCCNSGLVLALALHEGARWGLGWDLPKVIQHSRKILPALGASRTTLFPAELSPGYALSRDVPDWLSSKTEGAVLFYLAAVEHVGLIEDLGKTPWKTLIFEGHQGDSEAQLQEQFQKIEQLWGATLKKATTMNDDSGSRFLGVFTR